MKKAIVTIVTIAALLSMGAHSQSRLVCVWPDGSQTLPDYYTNTCPMGSTPMRR